MEHAIENGRAAIWLDLTQEQYDKVKKGN